MSNVSLKKRLIPWIPYVLIGLFATNLGEAWRLASGTDASQKLLGLMASIPLAFATPAAELPPFDLLVGAVQRRAAAVGCLSQKQEREEIPQRRRIRLRPLGNPGRYCSLRRSGISAKRDLDPDGTAHHVQPPENRQVRPEQKCSGHRRFRLR